MASLSKFHEMYVETYLQYHEIIRQVRGEAWANLMAGNINPSFNMDFESADAEMSLNNSTCLTCESTIPLEDREEALYCHENGDPAFYLCEGCDKELTEHYIDDLDMED